jgi:hypothetical protein
MWLTRFESPRCVDEELLGRMSTTGVCENTLDCIVIDL